MDGLVLGECVDERAPRAVKEGRAGSRFAKMQSANAIHLQLVGQGRQELVDLALPEGVARADVPGANVLPVVRKPAGSFPVDQADDVVALNEDVEAAQVAVGEDDAGKRMTVEGQQLGDVVGGGG